MELNVYNDIETIYWYLFDMLPAAYTDITVESIGTTFENRKIPKIIIPSLENRKEF